MCNKTIPDGYVDVDGVLALTKRSIRRSIYHFMDRYPDFPQPEYYFTTCKKLIWKESDIRAWIQVHKDELIRFMARKGVEVSYDE
ncbi:helix-turn-helix transcriptional regulator [Escherichia coli]